MKKILRAAALTMALTFSVSSVGFAAGGSIGHGDISVYKNGELSAQLTGQNPIEDGSLMICNGKCMIKSEGISLIGAATAQMAVTNETDTFKLYVKEGRVDYIINNNVRTITFITPQGAYTVAEVVFNASSSAVVKGSVVVDDKGQTEISVTEGRMVFATADGMKTVDANNKIVLALGQVGGAAAAGAGATAGAGAAVGGVMAVGMVGAMAAVSVDSANNSNKDSGNSALGGGGSVPAPSVGVPATAPRIPAAGQSTRPASQ